MAFFLLRRKSTDSGNKMSNVLVIIIELGSLMFISSLYLITHLHFQYHGPSIDYNSLFKELGTRILVSWALR